MEHKIDWIKIRKSIVDEIMKEENIKNCFCVPKIGKEKEKWSFWGVRQYRGIYWIRLNLKESNKLKDNYKGATAIHIMPYCITDEDVEKAEEKHIKGGEKCFYCRGPLFVDYDPDSGNFHKKIKYKDYNIDDIYPQVVLVAEGTSPAGPGWKKKPIRPSGWFDFSWVEKENRLDAIKTHWYFPNIKPKAKIKKEMDEIIKSNVADVKKIKQQIIALLEKVKKEIFK